MKKFVATVLAAALAISTLTGSTFAASDDNKPKVTGLGILPIVAGPAIIGGATSGAAFHHWTAHQYFKFYKWDWSGWQKVYKLKTSGWDVYKKVHGYKVKVHAKKEKFSSRGSSQGKAVVGCIMGSALGAITAAIRKGNALGNPLRWRSQAEHEMIVKSGVEKKFELTNEEAQIALAFCGLGSFALNWQQTAPVVRAGY
jgi:hypothetical protein